LTVNGNGDSVIKINVEISGLALCIAIIINRFIEKGIRYLGAFTIIPSHNDFSGIGMGFNEQLPSEGHWPWGKEKTGDIANDVAVDPPNITIRH
jgi:hypothetical protein